MKILILNGSPKQNSSTLVLTWEFMKGVNENNEHQIESVNIVEKKINYCQGCLSCWIRQDGHCAIQDDMNGLLDRMAESDMIVWSFPLYEYGVPGPLKTLLDRTNPFLKMRMYSDGKRFFHDTVVDLPKKKNVIICGCGFPYFEDNFASLKLQMQNIFLNPCLIFISEAGLAAFPSPELQEAKGRLFTALNRAGAEFNQTGAVSHAASAKLRQPMLPADMYVDMINSMEKTQ